LTQSIDFLLLLLLLLLLLYYLKPYTVFRLATADSVGLLLNNHEREFPHWTITLGRHKLLNIHSSSHRHWNITKQLLYYVLNINKNTPSPR